MGSQDISTRSAGSLELLEIVDVIVLGLPGRTGYRVVVQGDRWLPGALGAGGQRAAPVSPLRFLVKGSHGHPAQGADRGPVRAGGGGGKFATRWFVHEGHELVREAGHRAADADSADIGAAAHPVDPATFGHIAFDDRTPAAELDDALRGAVLGGEITLLVIAGTVA